LVGVSRETIGKLLGTSDWRTSSAPLKCMLTLVEFFSFCSSCFHSIALSLSAKVTAQAVDRESRNTL
jgi:hypothetical protein